MEDGVYKVYPLQWTGSPFDVYCREGWTVFQRRQDGSVDFYLEWTSYKEGFGNVENEMWLGNEKLFYLTSQYPNELRINVTFDDNSSYWLSYDVFGIGDEQTNFILDNLGSFTGNTGYDYMAFHRHQQFTTFDRDNDAHNSQNCAKRHFGAWWYRNCYASNLNGLYGYDVDTGVCLYDRDDLLQNCNIRFTEMSIRPA
ncbi:Fibrinogen C domain-containing protein 1-A [Holothuria leucospilota]|uniref:Fibrinogen C domain-containing protein 1-A n=1 Tax=Holothuria leucospilota TaxID=206669 RepID=A0A9Q1H4X0_HOLLE|nr:Fibrinogen C domain-containing protein 1-A [Holothuria leucospilota]